MSATDLSAPTLAHRLERQGTRAGQVGGALVIGVLLGAVAGALIYYPAAYPDADDRIAMYAIGGFLALLALVLVYSGVHQWFAMKTPETIVEMTEAVLTRAAEVHLLFRQPGPVSLQSLRANLVGEESWTVIVGTGGSQRTSTRVKYLGTFNILDSGPEDVDEHGFAERYVTFMVPGEIPPSGGTAEHHQVAWKIEVWGKVRGRADFYHPYRVQVRANP
jgi:MFS family permease